MKTAIVVEHLGIESIHKTRSISVGLDIVFQELRFMIEDNDDDDILESLIDARNQIQILIDTHQLLIRQKIRDTVELARFLDERKMVLTISDDFAKIGEDPEYFSKEEQFSRD